MPTQDPIITTEDDIDDGEESPPAYDPTQVELTEEDIALTYVEFYQISRRLEEHHAVFYQLWELGTPFFTNDISTAAVRFDKQGDCIQFMFNPRFWKSLSEDQRTFIIAHECLHVILKHGIRMADATQKDACNVAMDVVINELLLEQFGFSIDDIDPKVVRPNPKDPNPAPARQYCWLETIFIDPKTKQLLPKIAKKESFEYYFNRLPVNFKMPQGVILVDIHDFMDGTEGDYAIEKLGDSLSDEEKESLRDMIKKLSEDKDHRKHAQQRGIIGGGAWKFMDRKRVVKKKKWETIIKRWAWKFIRTEFDTYEHWARVNRRLTELPQNVILPTEMELQDKEEEGKIMVYFFLDTSGSCADLAERFWKAAKSLPQNRFEKKLFCFDTKVYDVDEKEGKLRGFGGTAFDIIEDAIQQSMKKETKPDLKKYPKAVFIISDGYGNAVKPAKPENWHWFLTDHASEEYIDKKSARYKLRDFE